MLYPLTFKPILKDKIWGGEKIRSILGKDFSPLPNCGESWEISGIKGATSVVKEGPLREKSLQELLEDYQEELVGHHVYARFGNKFPLLVKFIDANDDLSIQVHPTDGLAKKRHNSVGKTEMWYIIKADPGASLISGFNRNVSKGDYLNALDSGHLADLLNRESVEAGDVFFLPAGRIHTIGKGLLLAEIQQASDITYRIYDFDRVDDQGQKRELHTEEAIDAIDYKHYNDYKTRYERRRNHRVNVVTSNYFVTNLLHFDQEVMHDYTHIDSFVILVCVGGGLAMEAPGGYRISLKIGECVLVPASVNQVTFFPDGEMTVLESYVP